jgi:hypothetical protein
MPGISSHNLQPAIYSALLTQRPCFHALVLLLLVRLLLLLVCSALNRISPRGVSFLDQSTLIREKLAEQLEKEEAWSKAAQVLAGIDLDSGAGAAATGALCCSRMFSYGGRGARNKATQVLAGIDMDSGAAAASWNMLASVTQTWLQKYSCIAADMANSKLLAAADRALTCMQCCVSVSKLQH